ncbi:MULTISPECIES: arginine deiminase-related protein [Rhodanobacter]|uniref:arginine deiminase-related protein n=1 Tax=Rhodanobacter TaxID=75309 RepID=UPI000486DF23|nr:MULTISPECIES: arginine deiminase-related protein [Rhodanobacter]TAN17917.1 MAG: amidinotransferase [Rhodanobacter sp.]UJJ55589.1 arginine deiminase-related protein [Rhodanobacter thiooxydans]
MITTSPSEFLEAFATLAPLPGAAATARAAFMVAPAEFALAQESARDNRYMDLGLAVDPLRALAQHGALAQALRADVPVITFPGDPATPDAVFPNNVFATAPGRLIVGRMRHPVRQREAARADIRGFFGDVLGYEEIDLSGRSDLVAELTGSLVIDRARGVGYCGLSERCDPAGAEAMHQAFGLRLTYCFELAENEYHTNVVLTLLAGRAAIIAADGFRDPAAVRAIATACGDRAVWLSPAQKQAFAGNAITLSGHRVWMSARAARSLTDAQREALAGYGFAVGAVALDEIEKAGGSLRCCVGEIY